MVRWRITKKGKTPKVYIHYNESPIMSYKACGGPHSPIIDQRLINDIDSEMDKLMDIVEHRKWLSTEVDNNFAVKEMLGL